MLRIVISTQWLVMIKVKIHGNDYEYESSHEISQKFKMSQGIEQVDR